MPFSSLERRGIACALRVALLFSVAATLATAVPAISQQPQSATVTAGQTASFSVVATGVGPLTYQWRRDGFPLAGATASFVSLPSAFQGDAGTYDVLINDGGQMIESGRATLRVSPVRQPADVALDPARSPLLEGPSGGYLQQVVALPDGRFYVRGTFTTIDGVSRPQVARFNADGSLDRSFVLAAMDGFVDQIAAYPDGRLVAGGTFRTVDGIPSSGLARFRADGSRDPEFAVGVGFGDTRVFVTSFATAADGAVFAAGTFSRGYQGTTVRALIKIRNNGTLDPLFAASSASTPPHSIALAADGRLYATATEFVVSNSPVPQVVRFLPDGTLDSAFSASPELGRGRSGDAQVLRLSDGKIVIWGNSVNIRGTYQPAIIRLLDTGALDSSFSFALQTNESLRSVVALPNGDLAISTLFSLRRVKPDGSIDRSFVPSSNANQELLAAQPSGGFVIGSSTLTSLRNDIRPGIDILDASGRKISSAPAMRFPAQVYFLRPQAGGKLIVGGNFTHWNGVEVARVVRLNADLSLDSSFRIGTGPNAQINTGAVQPDGKILLVGEFSQVNGTSVDTIARLNADGSLDTTFRGTVTTGFWYIAGPVTLRDGRVIIGSTYQPAPFRVLGATGATLTSTEFGAGPNTSSSIYGVMALGNGQILVGGSFNTWNGQAKPRLVRLNSDGSVDASFTADAGIGPEIRSFDSNGNALQSSGAAIVTLGTRSPYVMRVDSAGRTDPAFAPAIPNGLYNFAGYLLQTDDRIVVWGHRGPDVPYFARLNRDGTLDETFSVVAPNAKIDGRSPSWLRAMITDTGDILATQSGRLLRYTPVTTPVITVQPASQLANAGSATTLEVTAVGPGTLSYQWFLNGQPIEGATSSRLVVPFAMSATAGRYTVTVSNANGSTTSDAATLTVDSTAAGNARLSNVSVRARVSNTPLITGLTVAGGTTEVLVRVVGPTLAQFGITGTLADPRLLLFRGSTLVEQNDNWGGAASVISAAQAVSAFPLPPNSLDAALRASASGSYTVHADGPSAGVVLTEIYETASANPTGRISNVSARYQVGTGENILIAGFTIGGSGTRGILVRGIGPTLARFGVPGTLADPQIALYSGVNRLAENNDWAGTASLTAAFNAVGAFPLDPAARDAALVSYLPAGSYTVQLSGVGGTTGEGLIEIYEIP